MAALAASTALTKKLTAFPLASRQSLPRHPVSVHDGLVWQLVPGRNSFPGAKTALQL
jgi:hypothetical protein